ncbi:hypothetical protein VCNHCC008D_001164 [Vibrio cholerae O1 str. NHCC-008D]|nr:hypothetical protein VCNHCC008D_001164 [Vibrio cholerae O1 str. NHCC-008D]
MNLDLSTARETLADLTLKKIGKFQWLCLFWMFGRLRVIEIKKGAEGSFPYICPKMT